MALAAFRPVEKHPHEQVIGEILETMREASRGEKEIIRAETHCCFAAHELAAPACNDVNFIACVRRLRVRTARGVHLDDEAAMRENLSESLALRAGNARPRFFD